MCRWSLFGQELQLLLRFQLLYDLAGISIVSTNLRKLKVFVEVHHTCIRIISAPNSANAVALAWPMPLVPPVTTAVWPSRENIPNDEVATIARIDFYKMKLLQSVDLEDLRRDDIQTAIEGQLILPVCSR